MRLDPERVLERIRLTKQGRAPLGELPGQARPHHAYDPFRDRYLAAPAPGREYRENVRVEQAIEDVPRMRPRRFDPKSRTYMQVRKVVEVRPRGVRLYSMRDQYPEAPVWVVLDRATGCVLGRVRGNRDWVFTEVGKLVSSQNCTLADVRVRMED